MLLHHLSHDLGPLGLTPALLPLVTQTHQREHVGCDLHDALGHIADGVERVPAAAAPSAHPAGAHPPGRHPAAHPPLSDLRHPGRPVSQLVAQVVEGRRGVAAAALHVVVPERHPLHLGGDVVRVHVVVGQLLVGDVVVVDGVHLPGDVLVVVVVVRHGYLYYI